MTGPLPTRNGYLWSICIAGRCRKTVEPLRLLNTSDTVWLPGDTDGKAHRNACAWAKVTSCAENWVSVGLQRRPSSVTDTNTSAPLPDAKLNAETETTRQLGAVPAMVTVFVIPGTGTYDVEVVLRPVTSFVMKSAFGVLQFVIAIESWALGEPAATPPSDAPLPAAYTAVAIPAAATTPARVAIKNRLRFLLIESPLPDRNDAAQKGITAAVPSALAFRSNASIRASIQEIKAEIRRNSSCFMSFKAHPLQGYDPGVAGGAL